MQKRFEALDAFRGLCALAVVVYHLRLTNSITELDFFNSSHYFVEFFFVLSGFVLTHRYGNIEKPNFNLFIKARFFRLYPLHLFMFLVFVILEFGKLIADKYFGLQFSYKPFTYKFAVSEMLPNLLLIQSWTPFTNALSFNAPAWSISIEFYTYIIFYLTIVLLGFRKKLIWFSIFLISLLLIGLESKFILKDVLRGLSCFFGGACTYIVYKKFSKFKVNSYIGSLFELLLVFIVVLAIQSDSKYRAVVVPLVFTLTVLLFSFESGIISTILKRKVFQYLGKMSYSIYMIHYAMIFCLVSAAMIVQKLSGIELTLMIDGARYLNFGNSFANNIVVLLFIFAVVFFARFTYEYIEVFGQNLNRRWL